MRETFTLKTSRAAAEVVIYAYLTAAEERRIGKAIVDSIQEVSLGEDGKIGGKIKSSDAYAASEAQDKIAAQIAVVSVNGETDKEKLWLALQELPNSDWNEVAKGIAQARIGISAEKKS